MPDLLTTQQKTKQRSDGHRSKFFLSIVRPAMLLSCQVAGAVTRGAITIPVDNGSGTLSLLRAGMTVKVVNSFGEFVTRLVSTSLSGSSPAISGDLTVDPNHIVWDDNAPVVIEDMHEPRIIQPEFDASTGISKKRSQTFSGQTAQPGPLLRLEGHKAGFLSAGSLIFNLNATGVPVAPGSSISSYLWQCPSGGTIANPNAQNTTITVTTPGGYWVYCTATDSNSKTITGVRHYWVHDADPESADYPYVDFETGSITETVDGGGQFTVTVSGVADFSMFRDRALVALWRRAWFGAEEGPISLIPGSENFVALGYIIKDSLSVDSEHGTVQFEVQLPAGLLRNLPLQALSIHAEQTIQYWFQTTQYMTLLVALVWLLYWHSNALEVMEWFIPTGGLYKKLFAFNEGSLYAQVADLASKFSCQVGCDKAGRMFVEQIPNLLTTANRNLLDTVTDLTDADWRERLIIPRRHLKQTSAVAGKGFFYDGANVLTPFCSVAPTKVRESVGGGSKSLDGLVVADQNDLNRLTGLHLAIDNSEIEEVRLVMSGDYSVIDVYPQRWYRMTIAAGDTPRGISATDMRLLPASVTLLPDTNSGYLGVEAIFKPEVFGPDGVFDPCPVEGEAITSPLADLSTPPTLPALAALATFASLRYLADGASAWTAYDATFVANDGSLDPFWRIKQKSSNPSRAIYWLAGNGGTVRQAVGATEKIDRNLGSDPPNSWSDATAPTAQTVNLVRIASSIFVQGRHYVAASWQNATSQWRAWVAKTTNDFVSLTWHALFEASDVQTKILSIAEDGQDGSRLWLTCWRNGELWLERWTTSTMNRDIEVDLGAATEAEINNRTYWAEVVGAPGNKDLVYVFGRMTSPAGLSGVKHIVRSANGGSSFTSFVADWGTDHCAALIVGLEKSNGQRDFYAARAPLLS